MRDNKTYLRIYLSILILLYMIAEAVNYWTDYGRMKILWH